MNIASIAGSTYNNVCNLSNKEKFGSCKQLCVIKILLINNRKLCSVSTLPMLGQILESTTSSFGSTLLIESQTSFQLYYYLFTLVTDDINKKTHIVAT